MFFSDDRELVHRSGKMENFREAGAAGEFFQIIQSGFIRCIFFRKYAKPDRGIPGKSPLYG